MAYRYNTTLLTLIGIWFCLITFGNSYTRRSTGSERINLSGRSKLHACKKRCKQKDIEIRKLRTALHMSRAALMSCRMKSENALENAEEKKKILYYKHVNWLDCDTTIIIIIIIIIDNNWHVLHVNILINIHYFHICGGNRITHRFFLICNHTASTIVYPVRIY